MNEEPTSRPESTGVQEDEIDLAQLWNILYNGKWAIATFVVLAILAGLGYLFVAQPVYRTDALLQVKQEQPPAALQGMMEAASLATGSSMGTQAATQMQIITSRSVLGDVVKKRGLLVTTTPNYFPFIGETLAGSSDEDAEPAQQAVSPDSGSWLDHYAWAPSRLVISAFAIPEQLQGEPFTLLALGGDQFVLYGPEGKEILAGGVGKTLTGTTASGLKVQIFVQKLKAFDPPVEFAIMKHAWLPVVQGLSSRINVAEQGEDTGILKVSLEGENPQAITQTVNAVANTYLRQNVEAQTQQAQQSLAFLKKQLPKLKSKLENASAKLTRYREANQAVGLDAEAQALLDQLVALESKRSSLKLKLAELSETYTSKHPAINAIQDQLASIEEQYQKLKKQINKLPGTQKKMLELKRAVQVNTTLYTSLLNRAQELRIVKAGTTGNVRIIDQAVVPLKSVAPKGKLVLALALVLGAMLGCGFVFLRAALRRTISDPHEIEEQFGLPVYAVVPFSDWMEKAARRAKRRKQPAPLLARDKPQEVATEALRSLRTSLYFAQMESGNNVILVTGPSPEVGKTFISANLGYLLAEAGKKVVIVDADMRRGKLHTLLNQGREPGLSQVLTGQVSLGEALRPLDNTECYLLSGGQVPPNPSELLMRQAFHDLIMRLKTEYDYVLIDAPPILPVTDAAVIAGTVPGIIPFMVARAAAHPRAEIEESIKRMTRNNTKIAGMVFNGLKDEHAGYSSGHGYYYYYQYEYKPDT